MKSGWFGERHRHYLAAKGISTKKYYAGETGRAISSWITGKIKGYERDKEQQRSLLMNPIQSQRELLKEKMARSAIHSRPLSKTEEAARQVAAGGGADILTGQRTLWKRWSPATATVYRESLQRNLVKLQEKERKLAGEGKQATKDYMDVADAIGKIDTQVSKLNELQVAMDEQMQEKGTYEVPEGYREFASNIVQKYDTAARNEARARNPDLPTQEDYKRWSEE